MSWSRESQGWPKGQGQKPGWRMICFGWLTLAAQAGRSKGAGIWTGEVSRWWDWRRYGSRGQGQRWRAQAKGPLWLMGPGRGGGGPVDQKKILIGDRPILFSGVIRIESSGDLHGRVDRKPSRWPLQQLQSRTQ